MTAARPLASRVAAGLLGVALASGCWPGSAPAMSRAHLVQRIERGSAPVVLDVRSTSEFEAGHVPGAVHIPFQSVASRHAELGLDPDQPIVVTCAHGPRAAWAARALRQAGYTDVVYLEGHMAGWAEAGLPLEKTPAVGAE